MIGGLGRMPFYALSRTLLGIAVALALNATVIMLIDFVELSRTVGARADLSFYQLFGLMLLKSPSVILTLLPFVFLFGTMGAFVTLNRTSELVAMRAAGVSAWRFILPAAGAAFVIGILTITVLNPIAAKLNGGFEERRTELTEGRAVDGSREIWLRQGDDRNQIVIHAASQDMVEE